MSNNNIETFEGFNLIQREIQQEIFEKVRTLHSGEILYIYGEAGTGKTTLIETIVKQLHTDKNINYDKSYFSWNEKFNIDLPSSGILEFLGKYEIINYMSLKIHTQNIVQNISDSHINEVSFSLNINQDQLSSKQITELLYGAFGNYSHPYIFFDAIDDLLSIGKEINNNDREITLNIINILVKKGVKIVLSSRNKNIIHKTLQKIFYIELRNFSMNELGDYVGINLKCFSQESISYIQNASTIYGPNNQISYSPTILNLMYTAYIYSKNTIDFNSLGDSNLQMIKNENNAMIEYEIYHTLEKLFRYSPLLHKYLQKTFLFQIHNRNEFKGHSIDISQEEWTSFENFISINGKVEYQKKPPEKFYIIHQNLYLLIRGYFLHQIEKDPNRY